MLSNLRLKTKSQSGVPEIQNSEPRSDIFCENDDFRKIGKDHINSNVALLQWTQKKPKVSS